MWFLTEFEFALLCRVEFIQADIQLYAENHTEEEPVYLKKLNRYTHSSVMRPRMLSGHLQGRLLAMFSKMQAPLYALDIGTYTGYSALCLAEGLQKDGKLYTLDNNDELMEVACRFFNDSPFADRIVPVCGDALESIHKLNTEVPFWDLVWMDADKAEYCKYYELLIRHLKPGGLMLADNVLWSGKITDARALAADKDTAALDAFNKMVHRDPRVEHVLLPVRDGIMVIRKK